MEKTNTTLMFPVPAPFEAAYRNGSTQYPVGPHCHDAAELYLNLSPLPDVLLDNKVSEVPAGTLIIIPPFCIHQLYHEVGVVYERYILSINAGWFDSVMCGGNDLSQLKSPEAPPLLITPGKERLKELKEGLDRLIALMPGEMSDERSGSPEIKPGAYAAFFSVLAKIGELIGKTAPPREAAFPVSESQKRVNGIIAYINEHICEPLSVSGLAAHFYLNPDYLSRMFKEHAHICISRYILLQKISTAQSLLREGYTVSEVQEKLGFSSYAYFFRTFSRTAGESPSRYREKYYRG